MEDDGFVLVSRRKQGKFSRKYKPNEGRPAAKSKTTTTDESREVCIDIQTITRRILSYV